MNNNIVDKNTEDKNIEDENTEVIVYSYPYTDKRSGCTYIQHVKYQKKKKTGPSKGEIRQEFNKIIKNATDEDLIFLINMLKQIKHSS